MSALPWGKVRGNPGEIKPRNRGEKGTIPCYFKTQSGPAPRIGGGGGFNNEPVQTGLCEPDQLKLQLGGRAIGKINLRCICPGIGAVLVVRSRAVGQ